MQVEGKDLQPLKYLNQSTVPEFSALFREEKEPDQKPPAELPQLQTSKSHLDLPLPSPTVFARQNTNPPHLASAL